MPFSAVRPPRVAALLALAAALVGVLPAALPAAAEPAPGEVGQKMEEASGRLEVVIEQYNDLREDLADTRARTAALDRRMAPLLRRLDSRRNRVGELAASAYRTGGVGRATVLLGADPHRDMMDRLLFLGYLAHQQQRDIAGLTTAEEQYRTARHTLDVLAAKQGAQERALAGKRAQIKAEITRLEQLRAQEYGVDWRPGRTGLRPALPAGSLGEMNDVVRFAYAQIGKQYRWAADGPDAYDCSGLVAAAYRNHGVRLPHNSRRQWRSVTPISRSQLRPGDLIFYYGDVHHVAVYAGDNRMIHAPRYGEPVRMDPVDQLPVYGYGRVRR